MNPELEPASERVRVVLDEIVRDKIYQSMIELGQNPEPEDAKNHAMTDHDSFAHKLEIEMLEFRRTKSVKDRINEAADVLAVIDSFRRDSVKNDYPIEIELEELLEEIRDNTLPFGVSWQEIKAVQTEKAEKKGEFDGKRYVKALNLRPDDEWLKYYEEHTGHHKIIY